MSTPTTTPPTTPPPSEPTATEPVQRPWRPASFPIGGLHPPPEPPEPDQPAPPPPPQPSGHSPAGRSAPLPGSPPWNDGAPLASNTDLGARVMDRTLCLAFSVSRFGTRKKANMAAVTVDADKALCSLSKKLLASEHLVRINNVVSQARTYLKETALPSFFKTGVYLVPMEMVTTIEAKLVAFRAEFETHVAAFLAEYPSLIEQMADPLGVLYNPTDYPSVGTVAASFGFEWRYVSFDVPGRLKAISAVMFEQEAAKAQAKLAMAASEVQDALRVGLKELVDGLVTKLQPTDDGKKRRLHATSVEKLQTFLSTFDLRNVTDDAELTALVERARAVMAGKDVDQLREDEDLRASVLAAFQTLQADIEPMVIGRGHRTFDIESE